MSERGTGNDLESLLVDELESELGGIIRKTVTGCKTCPFLYTNSEYEEYRCNAIQRTFGFFTATRYTVHQKCPLLEAVIEVALHDETRERMK